jgi:hypothetical protein
MAVVMQLFMRGCLKFEILAKMAKLNEHEVTASDYSVDATLTLVSCANWECFCFDVDHILSLTD